MRSLPFVAALFAAACMGCRSGSAQARPGTAPTVNDLSLSFVELSDRVFPAVVHVQAAGYAPSAGQGGQVLSKVVGAGSGAVISKDGYIVTNAHVVQWASRVEVRIPEEFEDRPNRSILQPMGELIPAEVVGLDPETDLALLKVDRKLRHLLPFGDSDLVRPGQLVFAFGSPRGLEGSVTMGVVSASGRQLQPEASVVYIQTDAPINPGNSGGPLVNARGELVGINTLIVSQSGGSEGLGFSLPSNIVKTVTQQLRAQGSVQRGIIGALTQTISPRLARGLGLPQPWGVIVSDVYPGSPAKAGGLRSGDIVISLNGKPMENARQFDVNIYHSPIGGQIEVEVLRGREARTLRIPVVERPRVMERLRASFDPKTHLVAPLGILGVTIDEQFRKLSANLREPSGVVVAAAPQGHSLRIGDVIHAVGRTRVTDLEGLRSALDLNEEGEPIVLRVERQGQLRYVDLELN